MLPWRRDATLKTRSHHTMISRGVVRIFHACLFLKYVRRWVSQNKIRCMQMPQGSSPIYDLHSFDLGEQEPTVLYLSSFTKLVLTS